MRSRTKKNKDVRMQRCESIWEKNPTEYRGKWSEKFKNANPIHVELGCGKGGFICELAQKNPDINYVAIEVCDNVLVMAMEKAFELGITNLFFVCEDVKNISEIFGDGEVSRIYINFCDPWHKKRQSKRRLTHNAFLKLYKTILKNDGYVYFKTDNRPLFDFTLEQIEIFGCVANKITYDLHNSEYNQGNIMTEYERNFSQKGFPIHRCEIGFNS